MIVYRELTRKNIPIRDQAINLDRLHYRLNYIRRIWDRPMIITSGLRSIEDHIQIYDRINKKREARNLQNVDVPLESLHLYGAAADVYDPHRELQQWIMAHMYIIEKLDLYMEAFSRTTNWVHFQIFPPRSLNRFFLP